MNELLITGATGKLGSQVLALLVEKMDVHNIAAIARDPAKLEAYQAKGVKVIQADYDQPASLDKASTRSILYRPATLTNDVNNTKTWLMQPKKRG